MKRLLIFFIFIMNLSSVTVAEKILDLKVTKIQIKENKIYDTSKKLYTGKILLPDGVSLLNVKNGDIIEFDYINKQGNIKGKVKKNFFNGDMILNNKYKGVIKVYYKEGVIENIESSRYKERFKEGILVKGVDKENNSEYNDFSKFTYLLKGISSYDAIFAFLGVSKSSLVDNGIYLKRKDFYSTEWDVMKNSKKIISTARINELGIKFIIFYNKNDDVYQIIRDDGDSVVTAIIENHNIKKILIEDHQGEVFFKKELLANEELDERTLRIKDEFKIIYEKKGSDE